MPGAAWWVEGAQGTVDRGAVGWAAIEPERVPLGEDTPFDLASLTKPLCTALLLALLEGEKRLDPGQPVSTWLEGMRGSAFSDASLYDLATHRSGLAAWRPLYLARVRPSGLRGPDRSRVARGGRRRDAVLGPRLHPARHGHRAGDRPAPGSPVPASKVVQPLGGPRIGFAAGDYSDAAATEKGNAYERRMAGAGGEGHPWRAAVLRGQVHDANAWGLAGVAGHAGLFGTIEAVAAVARELLRPARLPLGDEARERLIRPWPGDDGRTVGMVVAARSGAARGILPPTAPGHTGFTGTSLWLDPPSGRFFVLLTNRVHPEVGRRDFQRVRRGFHRLAVGAMRRHGPCTNSRMKPTRRRDALVVVGASNPRTDEPGPGKERIERAPVQPVVGGGDLDPAARSCWCWSPAGYR